MDSIVSGMTKEGAVYLAKWLEKMETQLLGLAGETGNTFAKQEGRFTTKKERKTRKENEHSE